MSCDLNFTYTQGQKLSRYSRQAKELLENGGPGLGEEELVADILIGPGHSKRPRIQGIEGTMGGTAGGMTMEIGEMAF